MTTKELIEKIRAGEIWFWSTGNVEDGDDAHTLVCPILIQPEDLKAYQDAFNVISEKPVPMILHCPRCWFQHIDNEVSEADYKERIMYLKGDIPDRWLNPPHKTHLCAQCKFEWKPALIPTTGVESL